MVKNGGVSPRSLQLPFFLEGPFHRKNGALSPQTGQFSIPFFEYFIWLACSDPDRFSWYSIFAPIIAVAKIGELLSGICQLDFLWRGR